MIDLQKLEAKIDALLESETESSLTEWLLNKRYGNLTNLLGKGSFVILQNRKAPSFLPIKNKTVIKEEDNSFFRTSNNRKAA